MQIFSFCRATISLVLVTCVVASLYLLQSSLNSSSDPLLAKKNSSLNSSVAPLVIETSSFYRFLFNVTFFFVYTSISNDVCKWRGKTGCVGSGADVF